MIENVRFKFFVCLIIVSFAGPFNIIVNPRITNIHSLKNPKHYAYESAPEILSLDYLLGLKKFRNIHHDSFCRNQNFNDIGHNANPNRTDVMTYNTISKGLINVGINTIVKSNEQIISYFEGTIEGQNLEILNPKDPRLYNHYASNFISTNQFGRTIKYIDVRRDSYHVSAIRASDNISDTKVAFFVDDIDNFYYILISYSKREIGQYINGNKNIIFSQKGTGNELEVYIDGAEAKFIVDSMDIYKLKSKSQNSHFCGLLFENSSLSNVDEFLIDYEDYFQDAGIDEAVECNNIQNGVFGQYCAFDNRCVTNNEYVKSGNKSYKFTLIKPTEQEVVQNRNNAVHSTVMLSGILNKGGNNYCCMAGGNKPLDAFVFSAYVLFPSKGDEQWKLDELHQELIIQEHHVGWTIPFSPSISININKGRFYINTIWLESLPTGCSASENPTTSRRHYFGRINTDEEELYLMSKGCDDFRHLKEYKKGEWHNITLYVKLGYTYGQKPRTILYLDNEKIIDWNTPNAYNCQEYGEYLEFGIYKWDWDNKEKRNMSDIQKRVVYFDNIHYYI